jgi:hypothetical protein
MGWLCADTCHLEAQAVMDRQTNPQSGDTAWDHIHRSPDPKSSHPVFNDGVLIENGELIFGIVEKTVGASQGGLVHVVFREKGPEAT